MPLPIVLTLAYVAINLAFIVWVAREDAQGRVPAQWISVLSATIRYGPPLLGFGYLVTIAGDWPYLLFVGAFFAAAFWLLDGLLNYPPPPER